MEQELQQMREAVASVLHAQSIMDGRNRTLAPATLNLHDRSFSPSELYDNLKLLLGRPVELTQLRNPLNPTRPILYYTLPPEK